jgi:hypothetical protein
MKHTPDSKRLCRIFSTHLEQVVQGLNLDRAWQFVSCGSKADLPRHRPAYSSPTNGLYVELFPTALESCSPVVPTRVVEVVTMSINFTNV